MEAIPGRILVRDEWYRHQRRQKLLQRNPEPAAPRSPSDQSSTSNTPSAPIATHISASKPSSQERIRSTDDAADMFTLDELNKERSLYKAKLPDSSPNIVFIHPPLPSLGQPPSPDDPDSYDELVINQGPYALEFARLVNKPILEYESWLAEAIQRVSEILAKERPRLMVKAEELRSTMLTELRSLRTKKVEEWERRYHLMRRARRRWFQSPTSVVDTCKQT